MGRPIHQTIILIFSREPHLNIFNNDVETNVSKKMRRIRYGTHSRVRNRLKIIRNEIKINYKNY